MENSENLVERLRKRFAGVFPQEKVVQGEPDRLSDLLEEAAGEIEYLRDSLDNCNYINPI
jgi:hypothetical protein